MFGRFRELRSTVADYTVGTVIVMVELAAADRRIWREQQQRQGAQRREGDGALDRRAPGRRGGA